MSAPAVATPRAGPPPETRATRAAREWSGLLSLEISRGVYVAASAGLILGYLTLWLTHFADVYGWVNDDYYLYTKGLLTIQNWQQAFLYQYNALQPYFFLISYLPLKTGLSLPSYPLPLLGDQTGQFRFLLLVTVFLHAALLAVWAWFAAKVTGSRLAALLSTLLFVTSPTLTLWTPQPESRLLGLPFALVGIWLLLRTGDLPGPADWRRAARFCLAGTLFGLAGGIHYTALYLVAPLSVVFWALWLWPRRAQLAGWLAALSFGIGGLWQQGLMEFLSDVVIGTPPGRGPTMSLQGLRTLHTSPWTVLGNLAVWAEGFRSQMGLLLLAAILGGWLAYWRHRREPGDPSDQARRVIALSIPLGLLYVWLSGSMPFFRQASVLQPFLFLFAAYGVVAAGRRVGRGPVPRLAATGVLLVLVGAVQWGQAQATFQGHQGVGQALDWVYAHKGDHDLKWLQIAWFGGTTEVVSAAELSALPPRTWLMSYFPMLFVDNNPTLQPYLAAAPVVGSWPSLFATDTLRAEHKGYGFNDWRADPLLRDVRVVEAGAIQAQLQGAPLQVASVAADSRASAGTEPGNVFDRDGAPDRQTAWVSADTPLPHTLDVTFAAPVELDSVQVVLPTKDLAAKDQWASRIVDLEIQGAGADGAYHPIWAGRGLDRLPVITAMWQPRPLQALRFVVQGETYPSHPTSQAIIEEIVFPGHTVEAPPLTRALPDLTLAALQTNPGGLVISGAGFSQHTLLVFDGVTYPTRPWAKDQLVARVPPSLLAAGGTHEAYLLDGARRSEVLTGPPTLLRLEPADTPADRAFNQQPDGSSALVLETEGATPGAAVLFDTVTLSTAYASQNRVTATVPREFLSQPGRHEIRLSTALGTSEPPTFTVTAPGATATASGPSGDEAAVAARGAASSAGADVGATMTAAPGDASEAARPDAAPAAAPGQPAAPAVAAPPVLHKLTPDRTRVAQAFNAQPNGDSALSVDVDNAVPGTVVLFDGAQLATVLGNEHWLTATVPPSFYGRPGQYEVYLKSPTGESNRLTFVVEP